MKVASKLINIGLSKISPSPRNPRKTISETELDELAQNIRQQGLLQPITVRPVGKDKYEIVCGERRYKAVKKNADEDKDKKAEIACIVKEMTDDEAFDAMIAENLQRKDVDPMEEAFAFSELVKAGKSIDEIALRFGKNKRFVQERCKLNALITPLKDMTTKGVVPIAGAMMLSKLKEELQNTFKEYLADRLERDEELTLEVIEIKRWIEREFLMLDSAKFIEYDEDDETLPPTEEWNTKFEKCATCCMNTGNAGCLFYSMKGKHYCIDRQCFENKTAAYYFTEIEKYSDRLTKEGQEPKPGDVVIIENDPDVNYGYDNVKRIRKNLMKMIRDKGYLIVSVGMFDGECKYYGDDKRLPKLIEQGKVIECITLGSSYYIDVDTSYYYVKGEKDADPEESPEAREARELLEKFNHTLSRMEEKIDERLREWCSDKGYEKRKGELTNIEKVAFWSFLLRECGSNLAKEVCGSCVMLSKDVIAYVKKNITPENIEMWQREFINESCKKSQYSEMPRLLIRDVFEEAFPDDYHKLMNDYAEKFAKRTEKIKVRLKELGYDTKGKKL